MEVYLQSIRTQKAMCGESEGPSDQADRQAMVHESCSVPAPLRGREPGGRFQHYWKKPHSVLNSQPTCPSHPQGLCRRRLLQHHVICFSRRRGGERERERETGKERWRETVFCSAILHDCLSLAQGSDVRPRVLIKCQKTHPADRMVFH